MLGAYAPQELVLPASIAMRKYPLKSPDTSETDERGRFATESE
jgi:hypothetical protein